VRSAGVVKHVQHSNAHNAASMLCPAAANLLLALCSSCHISRHIQKTHCWFTSYTMQLTSTALQSAAAPATSPTTQKCTCCHASTPRTMPAHQTVQSWCICTCNTTTLQLLLMLAAPPGLWRSLRTGQPAAAAPTVQDVTARHQPGSQIHSSCRAPVHTVSSTTAQTTNKFRAQLRTLPRQNNSIPEKKCHCH
jgi:hypothetical protein